MDDITKTTTYAAGATAEEIEMQLNGNTESLTEAIAAGGWALNPGKTNHLLILLGHGKIAATRALRKSKSFLGSALREMRVLGPYLPSDQGLGGEIARRVEAMQQAFRMCGNFWSSGTPQTLKTCVFPGICDRGGLERPHGFCVAC